MITKGSPMLSARVRTCALSAFLLVIAVAFATPAQAGANQDDHTRQTSPLLRLIDRDCDDFPSQRAAQIFFLNNNPAADPHRLDADGDRVVCESLPCPCFYGTQAPNSAANSTPAKQAKIKVVKVMSGELIKIREGSKKPYTVHLQGVEVDDNDSCIRRGAKADLQNWIRPGRVVRIKATSASKKRDSDKHPILNLVTDNAGQSIGQAQIATGWGRVAPYAFADKKKYTRLENQAADTLTGLWGACIPNSGSKTHPFLPGITFDVAGLRYQFGPADPDAWPEMQAERRANPTSINYTATAPPTGWSFVRVQVSITNLTYNLTQPSFTDFDYWRGTNEYDQFANVTGGTQSSLAYWCGTGTSYIDYRDDETPLSQGQTRTGYVCATIPATVQPGDTWRVQPEFDHYRFINVA